MLVGTWASSGLFSFTIYVCIFASVVLSDVDANAVPAVNPWWHSPSLHPTLTFDDIQRVNRTIATVQHARTLYTKGTTSKDTSVAHELLLGTLEGANASPRIDLDIIFEALSITLLGNNEQELGRRSALTALRIYPSTMAWSVSCYFAGSDPWSRRDSCNRAGKTVGQRLAWHDYGTHVNVLRAIVQLTSVHTAVEVGCGWFSTRFWLQEADLRHLFTFETEGDWLQSVVSELGERPYWHRVHVHLSSSTEASAIENHLRNFEFFSGAMIDIALVDGTGHTRPEQVNALLGRARTIVVHDTEDIQYGYEQRVDDYRVHGYIRRDVVMPPGHPSVTILSLDDVVAKHNWQRVAKTTRWPIPASIVQ